MIVILPNQFLKLIMCKKNYSNSNSVGSLLSKENFAKKTNKYIG